MRSVLFVIGRRLVAYRCSAGVWTIGVGHTGPEVHEGLTISDAQADEWLASDIRKVADDLSRYINHDVTKGQYIALISLAFNIGVRGLVGKCPKLMRALNEGEYEAAADEFLDVTNGGLPGLVKRRVAERALFLGEAA